MQYSIFFMSSALFSSDLQISTEICQNVCKYFLMKHLTYIRHLRMSVIVGIYSFHAREVLNLYVLDSFVSCLLQEVK